MRRTLVVLIIVLVALVSPTAIAIYCALAGSGLAVAGVYLLCGTGWALLAASIPLLLLAVILFRGLLRAG